MNIYDGTRKPLILLALVGLLLLNAPLVLHAAKGSLPSPTPAVEPTPYLQQSIEDVSREGKPASGFSLFGTVVRLILSLAIVLALLYGVFFVLKRTLFRNQMTGAGAPVRIVARVPVDGRRAILLVDVGDFFLLVGAGDHELSPLGEIRQPEQVQAIRNRIEEQGQVTFKDILGGGQNSSVTPRGLWGDALGGLKQSNQVLRDKIKRLKGKGDPTSSDDSDGRK